MIPTKLIPFVNSKRQARSLLSQKLKSLKKLISIIESSTLEKDVAKIQEEYSKYNKVLGKENEYQFKELERERKE